jgi:hypothetical protein
MQSNESRIIDALSDMDDRLEDSGVYELNPDIVAGWVEMCLGALEVLVTAKRGKYPHDPALSQSVYIHLDHAFNHMDIATDASDRDELDHKHGKSSAVDDDGILHIHHATARVALALTRKALVELEKTETRLSNCVIGAGPQYCTMTVSRRTTQPECPNRCIPNGHAERIHGVKWSGSVYNPPSGIARDGGVACGIIGNHESQGVNKNDVCSERRNDCVTVELLGPKLSDAATVTTRAQAEALFGKSCWLANWFPSEPPNSCKVDKVERNSPVVMNSFSAYGDDGGYWYYYRPVEGGITYTTSPARKLDTDCSLGNVTDKCEDKWGAGKPVTQWSMDRSRLEQPSRDGLCRFPLLQEYRLRISLQPYVMRRAHQ